MSSLAFLCEMSFQHLRCSLADSPYLAGGAFLGGSATGIHRELIQYIRGGSNGKIIRHGEIHDFSLGMSSGVWDSRFSLQVFRVDTDGILCDNEILTLFILMI